MSDKKNMTIGDVADALGISKTTVSRAISGKGRIGEATRNMVLNFIEEHNYVPSAMAKGLANQRTYNVGLLMPEDFAASELPFFQRALMGICESAHESNYNVLLSMSDNRGSTQLEQIVDNRKIDGVLLTRILSDDENIKLLKEREIPFVTIGSSDESGVVQVDNDNEGACFELTSELIKLGIKSFALISGVESYAVTQSRKAGFLSAVKENTNIKTGIYIDSDELSETIAEILKENFECIICMDDSICLRTLEVLRQKNVSVPGDIKVASFYGSALLDNATPKITSVSFNSRELGRKACKTLLDIIDGREYNERTLLDYTLQITESVK